VRTRLVPAALLASGLLLSGCGTSLQATTYTKESQPRDFAPASVGDLALRNLSIAAPAQGLTFKAGEHVTLTGSVVNTGTEADTLTGITTAAADAVTLTPPSVPVPAGGDADTWTADLVLKSDLAVGSYVKVVLTFSRAGTTQELSVPVRSGDNDLGGRGAEQDPYGGGE
jgi:hypothetical protein